SSPADEPDRSGLVNVREVVEVVDPLISLERRADTRLCELARDRLGHFLITHISALRRIEDDVDTVGESCLGEQLLELAEILLDRPELRVEAEMPVCEHCGSANALTVEDGLDDLVHIDGVVNGLTQDRK